MINRVVLVGRLTKDPELRQTQSGVSVASFSLAINRTFTNSEGKKEADFVPVVVWRKQAENVAQYVSKGHLVGVEGRLQNRSYDAQDGSKRFVMEVVADSVQFLEGRPSNNQNTQHFDNANSDAPDISDNDLPF